MCGITGFIDFNNNTPLEILNRMVGTLTHRGPDDFGAELYFSKESATIGLGQTRLSIIDTSAAGHQPMHYKHLRVVFNGEIYNFQSIKEELNILGHVFTSNSDTEMILHAFAEWGTECVHKFIGMFAIVLYDELQEKVFMFRDRAGVKPLFVYNYGNLMMFGSELKPFHQHTMFNKTIDMAALNAYFDYGYVPSPYCIYEKVSKVDAGEYHVLDLKTREVTKQKYWDVNEFYTRPKIDISYEEARAETKKLMISAYNLRMVADVPVGVFLSGGYDSTSVAAILQDSASQKIKTFTIGFSEGNNEAPFAKANAKHIGTDHYEYYCTTKEVQDIVPNLPYYYDEPFADSSAIPTTLVSQFARQEVTVALSADGGDEIFAGYNSYPHLNNQIQKLKKIPNFVRPVIKASLGLGAKIIPESRHSLKHKMHSLAESMSNNDFELAFNIFLKSSQLPTHIKTQFLKAANSSLSYSNKMHSDKYHTIMEMFMAADYEGYMQNDILTKVDRATMSASLEGREPMLDHRLIEFVAALPLKYKYSKGNTKKILKDITHEYIPKKMMDRPKTGFTLPITKWLREDLHYLIDTYLSEEALTATGIFNVKYIVEQVDTFKAGNLYYTKFIWKLLMFQMWFKKWN